MNPRNYLIAAVVLASLNASGGNVTSSEKIVKEIPLGIAGSFWIDNPTGDIEVVGSDAPNVSLVAIKKVVAVDRAALEEGRDATQISIEGDAAVRLVRTVVPSVRTARGSARVAYTLRVPRWAHVKVASKSAERVRVANIVGNVAVKGFNGTIVLEGVTGASTVDTTNGNIIYHYTGKPTSNAQLTTVNGDVEVRMPADASFDWLADTLRGDLRTTMPVRGRFKGTAFHASVNVPGGPVVITQTLLGTVYLLQNGTFRATAKSVIQVGPSPTPKGPRPEGIFRIPIVTGSFVHSENIANIEIGEIRGEARLDTRAGAITVDKVWGNCSVTTLGGPVTLGDIIGTVFARTFAGDILVNAAREGGQIMTGGGSVRLLYTGGATSLQSAGGDIVVVQAAAPITAETHSGDITITVDPNAKSQRLEAHTTQGNVIINVSPKYGAEIDATVMTSDPDANGVYSDFNGLMTKREQVGGKTKIHATGKINGGGEKMTLYAEGGDIHITSKASAAISVTPP
jgi:DUF4097 and DUF4098 domain-containing protein YvlB